MIKFNSKVQYSAGFHIYRFWFRLKYIPWNVKVGLLQYQWSNAEEYGWEKKTKKL